MTWTKVSDCSSVEILLDNGWAHVRRASDSRCVAELLPYRPHHRSDRPLGLGLGLGGSVLGEDDRSAQRAAPRPEVLRSEFLAHVLLDVFVQFPAREIEDLVVVPIAKKSPA